LHNTFSRQYLVQPKNIVVLFRFYLARPFSGRVALFSLVTCEFLPKLEEIAMSSISKLKLVTSKRASIQNPAVLRRNKLASKLHEQAELVRAKKSGQPYIPVRTKLVTDSETGERKVISVPKRVKDWFWVADNGKINLAVRYGSKIIEISKGKNAIECGTADELLQALDLLRTATLAGELDEQIETASASLRSGFQR
jgi:hypothetical protein